MITKKNIGLVLVSLIVIIGVSVVMMLQPISQDIKYHLFVDSRKILSVPNFLNVVSNIPFLLVGIYGLIGLFLSPCFKIITDIKLLYVFFFVGVALIAVGSSYYHLFPSNESLVYDRLPMTIAFIALFCIVVAEFGALVLAKFIFWPLILGGIFSVVYWDYTESLGEGDLRFYILVQFIPILVIPVVLLFFQSKFTHSRGYWLLLSSYILAKLFEYFDAAIFSTFVVISGHSVKHLVVAFGIVLLLNAYKNRDISSRINS